VPSRVNKPPSTNQTPRTPQRMCDHFFMCRTWTPPGSAQPPCAPARAEAMTDAPVPGPMPARPPPFSGPCPGNSRATCNKEPPNPDRERSRPSLFTMSKMSKTASRTVKDGGAARRHRRRRTANPYSSSNRDPEARHQAPGI
jgi:hypothetical protein